jgi:hypothetical protein
MQFMLSRADARVSGPVFVHSARKPRASLAPFIFSVGLGSPVGFGSLIWINDISAL